MKTKVLSCSLLFLLSLLIFLLGTVDAKYLRCRDGQELACVGDSKYDFIAKCGPLDYSEEVGETITGSKIEKMQYNCGEKVK
jgi:hypothetical protein